MPRKKAKTSGIHPNDQTTSTTKVGRVNDRTRKVLSWKEIPAWMRDNEYILSGYRR